MNLIKYTLAVSKILKETDNMNEDQVEELILLIQDRLNDRKKKK